MRFASYLKAVCLATACLATAQSLPTVDLGYEVHQAIGYNETGQYYNFSNIRFAQPPVGNLRFAAPVAPTGRNTTVQTGSAGVICPAANPQWSAVASSFLEALALGQPFNYTATVAQLQAEAANASAPVPDPRTSEDCLFLDVMVPKAIFEGAYSSRKRGSPSKGSPVLVWIYGGGYTEGDKTSSGNPAGLIHASQATNTSGVIYVAMNYRLGAFGWLSGPTLQSNGTANAALYDQRLALQWVQQNIHLFGGDPSLVTVFGESAGGGSIMHQITAYGGLNGAPPFQQALLQSPGWLPTPSNAEQEQIFETFLSLLNVTSIQEARSLPSEILQAANAAQVAASGYGSYTYGPVVDGSFVPALPGKQLLQGSYPKNLGIMVGHNADEGAYFTNPNTTSDAALATTLTSEFPGISNATVTYILQTLYPPVYDGSMPYTSPLTRAILIDSEAIFTCNTNYLDRAYNNQTYAYQFSVPPAFHGFDVPYTYYDGGADNESGLPIASPAIAVALQEYITSFAINGVPSAVGAPAFPMYGSESTILNLNVTGITTMRDPTANERCLWWQKALYY